MVKVFSGAQAPGQALVAGPLELLDPSCCVLALVLWPMLEVLASGMSSEDAIPEVLEVFVWFAVLRLQEREAEEMLVSALAPSECPISSPGALLKKDLTRRIS